MTTTREKLYQQFGPILLEALADILFDEINVLRAQLKLEPRTKKQLLNTLEKKNKSLPLYDWMKNDTHNIL